MAGTAPHPCPPPEVLGAYIEGNVDTSARKDIQSHLASCPECLFVIKETVDHLAEDEETAENEEDARRPSRQWSIAAAAALAAVSVLIWYVEATRDPLTRLRHLAAAAPSRPTEGYVDSLPYRAYSVSRSDSGTDDVALRLEARRLAQIAGTDARSAHARAVALLMLNQASEAASLLERAARLDPGRPNYWSDLAAAHLAVAQAAGDRETLEAIRAADQALALNARFAAAHFNRALALERLGRDGDAIAAYDRFLVLDPSSPWSAEARARRAALLH